MYQFVSTAHIHSVSQASIVKQVHGNSMQLVVPLLIPDEGPPLQTSNLIFHIGSESIHWYICSLWSCINHLLTCFHILSIYRGESQVACHCKDCWIANVGVKNHTKIDSTAGMFLLWLWHIFINLKGISF
mgnify:FL=1